MKKSYRLADLDCANCAAKMERSIAGIKGVSAVSVSFINAPRDFDDSVLTYTLSKKNLNVAGPASQIDKLSTLSVGTIDLSTFSLNKVYEMPIELPSDIRLLDNISTITVSFDSSKLETKTLNLPAECVQVVNLPSTYTLTVETERLMKDKGELERLYRQGAQRAAAVAGRTLAKVHKKLGFAAR